MTSTDLRPKQKRSQQTHDKFLKALRSALESKYFEHISIKELAEGAGVSVGTFYRRFENKEALLPLLYDDFGAELEAWVCEMEQQAQASQSQQTLAQFVLWLTDQTATFLLERKSVFRTIHLNARLHGNNLFTDPNLDRATTYRRISLLFAGKLSQALVVPTSEDARIELLKACDMAVYMLVNGLLDQILYPTLTPAIASDLPLEQFVQQLSTMLTRYLAQP
ncbi:TetR/AcrR family transcriptional regulator [Shewanella sp. WXL01]|uniref:TetR/AcrR family transcriptional regulator n=1 Tax=Shewanella sp. WXL01 TaxID=2709721 RepID=UPI00143848CD|nr:TetR/AcrR family transcriptional regulator [Shewanella sp. WXL01]NKF50409.1 TetR/AcrR family transcriptional regulator [Shewanella sp. WXL01]